MVTAVCLGFACHKENPCAASETKPLQQRRIKKPPVPSFLAQIIGGLFSCRIAIDARFKVDRQCGVSLRGVTIESALNNARVP